MKAVFPAAVVASPPVKKTPESEGPPDSKGPLPAADSPAPQPDPDAWIQVEKRHRQTKVAVLALLPPLLPPPSLSIFTRCFLLSFSPPFACQCVSDDMCVLSSSPPSTLQTDFLPTVEYFLFVSSFILTSLSSLSSKNCLFFKRCG